MILEPIHNDSKYGAAIIIGYIAFLIAFKGTALVNLFAVLLMLYFAFQIKKNKVHLIQLPDRIFLIVYICWLGGVVLSTSILADFESVPDTCSFVKHTLSFWLLYFGVRSFYIENKLKYAFCFGGLINFCLIIYALAEQNWNIGVRFSIDYGINPTAMVLSVSVPFLMAALCEARGEKWLRMVLGLVVIGTLIAIVLTRSRGAIVAIMGGFFITGMWYFLVHKKQYNYRQALLRLLTAVVPVLVIVGFVAIVAGANMGRSQGDLDRYSMYQSAVHMWEDHKIAGIGYSHWQQYYPEYRMPETREFMWIHCHNDFLMMLATTGALGAFGFLSFSVVVFLILLKRLCEQPQQKYLWAMLWTYTMIWIHGMGDQSILYNTTYYMFFGLLGLSLGLADKERK